MRITLAQGQYGAKGLVVNGLVPLSEAVAAKDIEGLTETQIAQVLFK